MCIKMFNSLISLFVLPDFTRKILYLLGRQFHMVDIVYIRVGSRTVCSDILYHRVSRVEYQTILIEDRKIPTDSPRVNLSRFIFLNLFPKIFGSFDTKTSYIFPLEMLC